MINAYNPTFWLLSSKMKVLAWFICLAILANLQGRTIKGFEIYGKKWDYILDIRWRFTPRWYWEKRVQILTDLLTEVITNRKDMIDGTGVAADNP